MNSSLSPDDEERARAGVLAMPQDWWTRPGVPQHLVRWFQRHLLSLHVAYYQGREARHIAYTGFLLKYKNVPIWVTAGHVIKELRSIAADSSCRIGVLGWVDGFRSAMEAGTIPLSPAAHPQAWIDEGDLDVGGFFLRDFYYKQIVANPENQFLSEDVWRGISDADPEGYYLLGFPSEWQQMKVVHAPPDSLVHVTQSPVAVPVRRISDKGRQRSDDTFWGWPSAFYAEVLPVANGTTPLQSIRGMSGGPIISLERTRDGRILYRLFGIQSVWLPESRILRATPMIGVEAFFENILSVQTRDG